MPSKTHWALNPKKWLSTIVNPAHRSTGQENTMSQTLSAGITIIRTTSVTSNMARLSRTKSRSKVAPLLIPNDIQENNTRNLATVTQLQLPAFSVRRERSSISMPLTSLNRQNTLLHNSMEPTIRKTGRYEDKLSINTKRPPMPPISTTTVDSVKKDTSQPMDMSLINMSRRCLVDYPRYIPIPEVTVSKRFSTASSLIDDDDGDDDHSSTSETFNDEQQHYNESKDVLLTSDVLSVISLADSQTSLNRFNSRPIFHYDEIPIHVSERTDDQSRQETHTISSPYSQTLEDNQRISTSKRSQSSATLMKKIEKRIQTSQSPLVTLDKPEFIRVTNASYRLTADKAKHSSEYHKNAVDSFVGCTNSDDSLRPAKNEECYATLPRGSSTEQINKHIQYDLRSIVDGYIRPMVTSIGSDRLPKTHHQHRSKRAQVNNNHTQLVIEDITDKLLSSIDYSIYTQHQRCC